MDVHSAPTWLTPLAYVLHIGGGTLGLLSGLTAALFGPVLSVVGGGVGTIVAVLAAALTWPQIRHLGPLAGLRPARTVSSA